MLSNMVNKIQELVALANEEVSQEPMSTYQGRVGRQRQAKDELIRLKRSYRQELLRTSAFILVTGSEQKAFEKAVLNMKEVPSFSANPEAFFEEMTARISNSLFDGNASIANLFDVAGRHLEDMAHDLEIIGYPMLQFSEKYNVSVKNKKEFTKVLKKALIDQVGGELVGIKAVSSIVDEAIANGHSSVLTPVLLKTSDKEFILSLLHSLPRLTKNVFVVVAGKSTKDMTDLPNAIVLSKVNEETISEALTIIKKSIK